jgi:thioredoxin-related protein
MALKSNLLLPIGADMPMQEHKMLDVSGKELSMKDALKGNGVLVMFSCNTCPYVIKNEERISNLSDFTTKLDFGMIVLNSNEAYRNGEDSYKSMQEFAIEKKLNCFYVVDKDYQVADAFGANRTPECFLFDKNMKLVYHGAIDDNATDAAAVKRNHLMEAMTEISQGKTVSIPDTKSVGCSIKRKVKYTIAIGDISKNIKKKIKRP